MAAFSLSGESSMVELLSPAGDMTCFQAALLSGADAVYVGGDRFGARAYAENFDSGQLVSAIDMAHLFGKKVYMTVNTLMKEAERKELAAYMTPMYEAGLDGVIVQDFGALCLLRETFPDLPLHASTQMAVADVQGALLLKQYGVSRIVPARELSLQEIAAVRQQSGLEMETFIHGAMCYSYSGHCLFSSMLGQRSGNRGRCAGPCRLPYRTVYGKEIISAANECYPLSLKDLCTLEILPKLIDAGIDSFKIEGRMKSPQYVAFVTALYRKYIDLYRQSPETYEVSKEDIRMLTQRFCRGGVQSGYYFVHNARELVTLDKPGYDGNRAEAEKTEFSLEKQIGVDAYFKAEKGKPVSLTLVEPVSHVTVSVSAQQPQQAQNRPSTEQDVIKQLDRTGNTMFAMRRICCDMEPDLFLQNKMLNELRRSAVAALQQQLLAPYRRKRICRADAPQVACPSGRQNGTMQQEQGQQESGRYGKSRPERTQTPREMEICVSVESPEQLAALPANGQISRILFPAECLAEGGSALAAHRSAGSMLYLKLPPVMRRHTAEQISLLDAQIRELDPDGFVVGSLDGLAYIRAKFPGKDILTGTSLYLFNCGTISFLEENGSMGHIMSYELHNREMCEIVSNSRAKGHMFFLPVYGYIPVMESAGCVLKTNRHCLRTQKVEKQEPLFLLDRQNKKWPVVVHCKRCENTVYNAVPLSLHKETDQILAMPFTGIVISFTVENKRQTRDVFAWYRELYRGGRRAEMVKRTELLPDGFTKGHFLKGVE